MSTCVFHCHDGTYETYPAEPNYVSYAEVPLVNKPPWSVQADSEKNPGQGNQIGLKHVTTDR